jgi:hypothetical protein
MASGVRLTILGLNQTGLDEVGTEIDRKERWQQ